MCQSGKNFFPLNQNSFIFVQQNELKQDFVKKMCVRCEKVLKILIRIGSLHLQLILTINKFRLKISCAFCEKMRLKMFSVYSCNVLFFIFMLSCASNIENTISIRFRLLSDSIWMVPL